MSSRQTNDPVTERKRRLENMMRKREAYQKAIEEIRQDRSFPRTLRRIVEETIRLQN
mgnify:FL=1